MIAEPIPKNQEHERRLGWYVSQQKTIKNHEPPKIQKKTRWKFTLKYPSSLVQTHTAYGYNGNEPDMLSFIRKYGGGIEILGAEKIA